MKIFLFVWFSFAAVFASASSHKARFELNSAVYTEGVRFVEFKTDKVDVAYKVLSADDEKIVFNVYFTNVSKRNITVDRSIFYVASLDSKETFVGMDPAELEGADMSDHFPRSVLKPQDSAGGQIVFSVKDSEGRWSLKNRLTSHAFNFAVKKNPFGSD